NDPAFSKKLAALGDIYVDDAFSTAHRAHASTEGITHFIPSYAGFLMQEEIGALSAALEDPKRPAMALVAGAKVSTKISVLENITGKVDAMIVGGAMANTFLLATGYDIGDSMAEPDMADAARKIMAAAERNGCALMLPVDTAGRDDKILDIGPESIRLFEAKIDEMKTVLMNGPVGVFETPPFDAGTNALARHIARLTREGRLVSVAGGGDTVSALNHAGAADGFTYVSTAGGAFLEWLEGKTLPAIPPLYA
ncbi:MAG: phosphoglycerate kinase, partial [Rickettsiales bacterium]|nr:phosphoglycerate kinase [Rickettsiales bacterium]